VRDDDNKGREQTFAEPEVEDVGDQACPTCAGTRLNATARAVSFDGHRHHRRHRQHGVTELRKWVTEVRQWFEGLTLTGREAEIARDLVPEIKSRLEFLEEVGLGYLTLDRGAPTLRAARRSASAWRRSSAATCRACATCSTSRPSACTRATTRSC
jgi:excinuclease ABC subunit A